MNTLLMATNYDTASNCTFGWPKQMGKHYNSIYKVEEDAVRSKFEDNIEGCKQFIFYGHGNSNKLVGQDKNALCDFANAGLLKGKRVYAVSCLSGRKLGPYAVKHGAERYIGWDTTFVWTIPMQDKFKTFTYKIGTKMRDKNLNSQLARIKRYAMLSVRKADILTKLCMAKDTKHLTLIE